MPRANVIDPQDRFCAELQEQGGRGGRFWAGAHGIKGSLVPPDRLDLPFAVPPGEELGADQPVGQRPLQQLSKRGGHIVGAIWWDYGADLGHDHV